jgi:hypothetical protein
VTEDLRDAAGGAKNVPLGNQSKIELIDALERTKSKAYRLSLMLRFRNRDDEARQVAAGAKRLSRRIDDLLAAAMSEWLGKAAAHKRRLTRANSRLQRAIRDIQRNNDVAANVVKALSCIDDAIRTASLLLHA